MVDTGATMVAMGQADAERLGLDYKHRPARPQQHRQRRGPGLPRARWPRCASATSRSTTSTPSSLPAPMPLRAARQQLPDALPDEARERHADARPPLLSRAQPRPRARGQAACGTRRHPRRRALALEREVVLQHEVQRLVRDAERGRGLLLVPAEVLEGRERERRSTSARRQRRPGARSPAPPPATVARCASAGIVRSSRRAPSRRRGRRRCAARARCPASGTRRASARAPPARSASTAPSRSTIWPRKWLGEQRDVLAALAQRRQVDREHVAGGRAGPRAACRRATASSRIAVGGGDARARRSRCDLRRADAHEGAGLEHAQQLDLQLERHLGDLVEEQRAAVGALEEALVLAVGAGEAALLVAEQLALDQVAARSRRS